MQNPECGTCARIHRSALLFLFPWLRLTGCKAPVGADRASPRQVYQQVEANALHSCPDQPAAIEEVRRILHEHLAGLPATGTPSVTQR